jgi:hypothetical protein
MMFFLIIFYIGTSKRSKIYKILIKKKLNFLRTWFSLLLNSFEVFEAYLPLAYDKEKESLVALLLL